MFSVPNARLVGNKSYHFCSTAAILDVFRRYQSGRYSTDSDWMSGFLRVCWCKILENDASFLSKQRSKTACHQGGFPFPRAKDLWGGNNSNQRLLVTPADGGSSKHSVFLVFLHFDCFVKAWHGLISFVMCCTCYTCIHDGLATCFGSSPSSPVGLHGEESCVLLPLNGIWTNLSYSWSYFSQALRLDIGFFAHFYNLIWRIFIQSLTWFDQTSTFLQSSSK